MNKKIASLLRERAREFSTERNISFDWAYKELKKLWDSTPKNKKHTLGL